MTKQDFRNRVICFADFRQRNKSTNQNQLLFFYSISISTIQRNQIQSKGHYNNLGDNFQSGRKYRGARCDWRWILDHYNIWLELGSLGSLWGKIRITPFILPL